MMKEGKDAIQDCKTLVKKKNLNCLAEDVGLSFAVGCSSLRGWERCVVCFPAMEMESRHVCALRMSLGVVFRVMCWRTVW